MTREPCDRCGQYEAEVRTRYAFTCRPCAELAHNTNVEWCVEDDELRRRRGLEFNLVLLDRMALEKAVSA